MSGGGGIEFSGSAAVPATAQRAHLRRPSTPSIQAAGAFICGDHLQLQPAGAANRTEGPPFIGNTEPQRIELQKTVVRDSGRPHSGDVPADKTTPGCELKIKDLKNGSADGKIASNGSQVTVKYVGELLDGKIIDPRGEYKFKLGAGCVIRGWELGILGMRVGGKRRLIIPPHLGYGAKGGQDGSVPPNSWLKYEIKLTNVEGCQEYDSSFVKQGT